MVQFLARGMKDEVPGLIRKKGKGFQVHPPSPSSDLNALPLPARDLLDIGAYLRKGGVCNIQSKRGCSFQCIYCTYPLIEGRDVRLREPQRVVAEVEGLKREYGVDHFFFVDNIFNYPRHHAWAICENILDRGLEVKWTCYAHPAFLDPTLADLMARSGCEGIEFGTDSGSPRILTALQKGFGPQEIRLASSACQQAGIQFCHSLILGGPGEDRETLGETFRLMEEVDPTAVIAMVGVRIYPRTALAQSLVEAGYCRPSEIAYPPKFYISPDLGEGLGDIVIAHAEKSRSWIVPGQQINYSVRLQQFLRRRGKMGPIWAYMRHLRGRGQKAAVRGEEKKIGEG